MVDEFDPQIPFAIVHCKTFNPPPRPVTEDVANVGVVIVPLPEITDHVPVPTSGVFPIRAKVGVLIQIDWLEPAFAIVGTLSTCMFRLDVLEHTPLAIVHCKVFNPNPKPVTALVGELGFDIVPLPAITDHVPIPVVGVFPASTVVGLLIQRVWLGPATAVVGILSTCMLIVELLVPQPPPLIVHCNTLTPNPRPVTLLVASVGVVTVPLPEITDQVPVPLVGVLAANTAVGLLIQTVWFGPATGAEGIRST